MAVTTVAMVVGAVMVWTFISTILSGPVYAAPGVFDVDLDSAAEHSVMLQVGTTSGGGNVTFSEFRTVDLISLEIVDPAGGSVPFDRPSSFTETVARGNRTYEAVARFDVVTPGVHRITIDTSEPVDVIVVPSITDVGVTEVVGFASVVFGALLFTVGLVFAIIGFVRRRDARSGRSAAPFAG